MKTTYQRISDILFTVGVSKKEIEPSARFTSDLGLDSLDMAYVITLCKSEFNITIPDAALYRFAKVVDMVEYIQTKLKPADLSDPGKEKMLLHSIAVFVGFTRFRKLD